MSFAIIRMQKFKSADVTGMQIHNQREKESHTNPDINKDRTSLNYDLVNEKSINFSKRIQEEIDRRYVLEKTIRKDAVKLCEFVVTSDKDFFDSLSPDQEKKFFKESLAFLQKRYGQENIIYGIVHKDEKTPHMHVGMVPITKDGKLAAKQFFGKKIELQQLQDKFHEHVTSKGFNLERGESSDRKHIEINRLKVLTAKEELKNVEHELKEKESDLDYVVRSLDRIRPIRDIETKEKGGVFRPKTVKIGREDYQGIKTLAQSAEVLRSEIGRLKFDVMREKQQKQNLAEELSKLKIENRELREENKFLKKTIEQVKLYCEEQIPDFSYVLGYLKAQVLNALRLKPFTNYFDKSEIEGAQSFLTEQNTLKNEQQKRRKYRDMER